MLERRIRELININGKQFGFMTGTRMASALFVDIEKTFNSSKMVKWGMRKKGLPEVIVRAVRVSSGKVKVGSELCEEFLVQVGVHHISVLLLLTFAVAVITECAREGLMKEILCEDLILMSESMKSFRDQFLISKRNASKQRAES